MLTNLLSKRFFSTLNKLQNYIHLRRDSYNAVHITPKQQLQADSFQTYMSDLLTQNNSNNTSSIWVHLTNNNLRLVHGLVNEAGFKLHHSKGDDTKLYKWMNVNKPDLVPPYSVHVISCGGVIVRNNHILLVEEKKGKMKGNFGIPGGRADKEQGIQGCTEREVFEQVGLKGTFKRILWLRQLSGYVYGSYDMFFACLMNISQEEHQKLKMCNDELASIEWVHLSKLKEFMKTRSFGTQWKLAEYLHELHAKGYNFEEQNGFSSEVYTSPVDKKQRYFGQHFLG